MGSRREHALRHPRPQGILDTPRFGTRGSELVAEAAVTGEHLGQVEGDVAVLPTCPLCHIWDDTVGIATVSN